MALWFLSHEKTTECHRKILSFVNLLISEKEHFMRLLISDFWSLFHCYLPLNYIINSLIYINNSTKIKYKFSAEKQWHEIINKMVYIFFNHFFFEEWSICRNFQTYDILSQILLVLENIFNFYNTFLPKANSNWTSVYLFNVKSFLWKSFFKHLYNLNY